MAIIGLPFFQFNYTDFLDKERVFGPVFHKEEFLFPLLELQESIKNLSAQFPDGKGGFEQVYLKDICNNPLSRPDRETGVCNIQSILSYWQDKGENLNHTKVNNYNKTLNYLDHFLKCAR